METPRYELKINANHPLELSSLVNGLAEQLSGKVKAHIAAHSDLPPAGLDSPIATKIKEEMKAAEEAPKKEKKKRTPAEVAEAITAVEAAPIVEEAVSSEPITKEAIAQALQSVSEKVNFTKAKEILTSFNKEDGSPCKKVSDVQPADYEGFMIMCRNAR